MRHLPNLLTLANLFCGCIAITFILSAQNFTTSFVPNEYIEVPSIEQPYWGSLFIFLAAAFDVLDGLAARGLKVFSPIGKDLDSLADLVSFGVAPSMILFKMLWSAYMLQPDAMDVSMLAMSPAFLVACFGALRLARFNTTTKSEPGFFTGMPIPATGIFVATFPLILWQNPLGIALHLYNPWLLYATIAVLCWLMVSRIAFFRFLPSTFRLSAIWPQLLIVITGLALLPVLQTGAIATAFILYILLAFVYKPKQI